MFILLLVVLYAIVMYHPLEDEEDKLCPRLGSRDVGTTWGGTTIVNSTTVIQDFAMISSNPRPTLLLIKLMKDDEDIGTYAFQTDEDGPLILIAGTDVGTLVYEDLANNQKVNVGDRIEMTNLSPGSEYVIALFWDPTDDCLTETDFWMPAG